LIHQHDILEFRKEAQMIFQDPYASLDSRMKVRDIIAEGIDIHHLAATKEEVDLVAVTKAIVEEILPVLNEKELQVEFTGEAQTIITTNKSAMTELI